MATKIEIYVDSSEEMGLIAPFLVELERLRDKLAAQNVELMCGSAGATTPPAVEIASAGPAVTAATPASAGPSKPAGMDVVAARMAIAKYLDDAAQKKQVGKVMKDEFGATSLDKVKDYEAFVKRVKEVCGE